MANYTHEEIVEAIKLMDLTTRELRRALIKNHSSQLPARKRLADAILVVLTEKNALRKVRCATERPEGYYHQKLED